MRRVVVTGLGMVSPLADGVEATWERIACRSSLAQVQLKSLMHAMWSQNMLVKCLWETGPTVTFQWRHVHGA